GIDRASSQPNHRECVERLRAKRPCLSINEIFEKVGFRCRGLGNIQRPTIANTRGRSQRKYSERPIRGHRTWSGQLSFGTKSERVSGRRGDRGKRLSRS